MGTLTTTKGKVSAWCCYRGIVRGSRTFSQGGFPELPFGQTTNKIPQLFSSSVSSRTVLSNRTFCSDENVLYLCCPKLQPHVAREHWRCD